MTCPSRPAQNPRPAWPSPGLVLVAPGGVCTADGQRLADLLGLRVIDGGAMFQADPNGALAELVAEPSGWLLPLELDPGAALACSGCWSEALAAWRQPVVLQLPAAQAATGPARAYVALLKDDGVPLVGAVQLGQPWQPAQRRADGLPWLGCLPLEGVASEAAAVDGEQARQELRLNLLVRWQLSSARGCAPEHPVP